LDFHSEGFIFDGIQFSFMKKILQFISLFVFFAISSCQKNDKLFTLLSSNETGIEFENSLTEVADFNVIRYGYFYNGGGVAAADFNNDGLTDLYFTGNLKSNRLYLNKGDMKFDDITKTAGVAAEDGWNTGVTVVDINNDGFQDIYVCRSAAESPQLRRNLLFINNKNLTFTEKAAEYGLDDSAYSTHATFFDYDRDGDLDVFLLNHSIQKYAGFSRNLINYKTMYDAQFSSRLMQNNDNKFTDVSEKVGIKTNVLSFGLGSAVSDLNNDGWLDLYVSNDYNEEDYLYINQKDGTFKETVKDAMGHVSLFSMGNDAADINNDGLVDVFSTDMMPISNERIKMTSGDDNYDKYNSLINSGFHHQISRNMLQLNNGNGTFSEIGQLAGISNTDWSWSPIFADLDLDGFKDLYVTSGYARDYTNMDFLKFTVDEQTKVNETGQQSNPMEVIKNMPTIDEPNMVFKNNGDLTFTNTNQDWGLSQRIMSNGSVIVDLDNDGDLDIVTNNINEKSSIFRNNTQKKRLLKVDFKAESQAYIFGLKVILYQKDKIQMQECNPTRGYQSSCIAPLVFGLRDTTFIDSLKVIWADGKSETIKNFEAEKQLTFNHKDSKIINNEVIKVNSIFKPIENSIDFIHNQSPVNDFKIQPLLPQVQSVVGPKIIEGDFNNDKKTDLLILGGKNQASEIWLKSGNTFTKKNQNGLEKDLEIAKSNAVLIDIDNDKDLDCIFTYFDFENPQSKTNPKIFTNDGTGNFSFFKNIDLTNNNKTIATTDFNKDGYHDLIIGGGVVAQNYPSRSKIVLLKGLGKGNFELVKSNLNEGNDILSDAKFADINQDGSQDLITSSEYGNVNVYINDRTNEPFKVKNSISQKGIWNTLEIADLDNDGDLDLVAGNIGKNNQPVFNTNEGLMLYAEQNQNKTRILPILAYKQSNKIYPFAARDEILDQKPSLKKTFTSYSKYSNAVIEDVIESKNIRISEANDFETAIFINEKGIFKQIKLPIQAQFSQVYAIKIHDFNQDGWKDVFLMGNENFARVRIGKSDANFGQLFLNSKKNNFYYCNQNQSGLNVKGDCRGLSIIENQIIIGLNGEKLKFYSF
jgi:enediyne biosynthesis protein E4